MADRIIPLRRGGGPTEPPHIDADGLALLRAILADLRAHIEQDANARHRAELGSIANRLAEVIERHEPPKGAA